LTKRRASQLVAGQDSHQLLVLSDSSFYPISFPTADFLPFERLDVEVAVSRILAREPRIVNLFAHPSLAKND
jgi:hypothetical protein